MGNYYIDGINISEVHSQLMLILAEFNRICKKYNIKYSIEGGTLLGAVKYGGFVPWDDDIDIVMLRAEYEKFLSVCKEDLSEDFFLQNVDTDAFFPLRFSKLRLNNTKYVQITYDALNIHQGLFIDIYPYDYAFRQTYRKKIHLLGALTGAKNMKLNLPTPNANLFKYAVYKIGSRLIPLKIINCLCNKIMLSRHSGSYVYNFTNPLHDASLLPAQRFEKFTTLNFGGIDLMAIADYDIWLKETFGERYMIEEPDKKIRRPSHAVFQCNLQQKADTKKIAILTFHRADNYGALIQAYALVKFINKLARGLRIDTTCEVLDYFDYHMQEQYRIKEPREYRRISTKAKYFVLNKYLKKRKEGFDIFRNSYIPMSKQYDRHDISRANEDYDVFVCGSDQIWNTVITDNDYTYFLDFVKDKKKTSFAASIGMEDIFFKDKENNYPRIKDFHSIAVREKSLIERFKEWNIDVTQVLDPVFLLTVKEYAVVEAHNMRDMGDYILLYILLGHKELHDFARKLSQKTHMKVVFINNDTLYAPGEKSIRGVLPGEFLKLIRNAKYVVTSSYHGLSLSLIYNTEVFYWLSTDKCNANSRLMSLVDYFGLEDRNIADITDDFGWKDIDWDSINFKIEQSRIDAKKYIVEKIL